MDNGLMDNLYFTPLNQLAMKENILKTKSFDFAVRIVKLYKFLKKEHNEFILSQQIVRSGTSI